jgi:hypothetical protein
MATVSDTMAEHEAGPANGQNPEQAPAEQGAGQVEAEPRPGSWFARRWPVIVAALTGAAIVAAMIVFAVRGGFLTAHQTQTPQTTSAYTDAARALVGVWRGSYICRQGETGVELSFTELRTDGTISGTFSFFNMPGHTNAAEGEFALSGRYDLASGKLIVTPGAWIKQPANYVTTGFIAYYRPPSRAFAGTMDNNACGQITVTKSGD